MKPRIVGIDGAIRKESQSRKLLALVGDSISAHGGDLAIFSQESIRLPLYDGTAESKNSAAVQELFSICEGADAFILCSPEYHGSMSGALKNALDWFADAGERINPEGRVFGLIGGGGGLANSGATLQMMMAVRAIHGWVMPDVFVSVPNIGQAIGPDGWNPKESAMVKRVDVFSSKLIRYAAEFRLMRERLAA